MSISRFCLQRANDTNSQKYLHPFQLIAMESNIFEKTFNKKTEFNTILMDFFMKKFTKLPFR